VAQKEEPMKLSRASIYAVYALVYLAGAEPGKPSASHAIAQAVGMPERFLLKVLVALGRARLVLSLRGPFGGYRLARPAKDISLLDVVEAVEGPVRGSVPEAATGADARTRIDPRLQAACDGAAEVIRRNLGRVSVAELTKER
jgi:Rrf2 family protein